MATKRCCCGTTCVVGTDDFNRVDANPPTGSWSEISGDWAISTNTLAGLTDGTIVTSLRQAAPVRAGAGYAHIFTATIVSTGGYNEWHFICNFVDANNFYWIRVYEEAGYYWPAFYRHTGGADNLIMDKNTHPMPATNWALEAGVLRLKICMANVQWSIAPTGAQGENRWQTCVGEVVTSLPVNVSHGLVGFKKGRFDDVEYDIHWESQINCPYCNCICYNSSSDVGCVPEDLLVTMIPSGPAYNWGAGSCPTPANITLKMWQRDPTTGAFPTLPGFGVERKIATKKVWYSELLKGEGSGPPIHGATPWLLLVCDGPNKMYLACLEYPNANLTGYIIPTNGLHPVWEAIDDPICGAAKYFDSAASTCDPFSLTFRRLYFPRSAAGQCEIYGEYYDVVITEAPIVPSTPTLPYTRGDIYLYLGDDNPADVTLRQLSPS